MNKSNRKQCGAALILLVFILSVVMISYLIKSLNSRTLKVERERRTVQQLATAKQALIAWAVTNSVRPGQLPYPDRGNDPAGYNGRGDCGGNPVNNTTLLLGQLPIFGSDGCVNPEAGLGIDEQGIGGGLWYAVSPNLVHNYAPVAGQLADPFINPSIISNPTYPWLRVLDKNGALISNRVAAVLIAPGNAIGNQVRTNIATPENFLDTFPGGSNSDYDGVDEDFFIVDGSLAMNDKLTFITIDELMEALEKRVAQQVVFSLNDYYENSAILAANRFYPYAADLSFNCIDGIFRGALPIGGVACSTPSLAGLPAWFDQNGWENFIYYAVSPGCSDARPARGCANGIIAAGGEANLNAIVVTTGAALPQTELIPIFAQNNRPSIDVRDYLDSDENTNNDDVFDAKNKPKSNVYNDQIFIVAP